jgi:heat shock protein HtpX
MAVALALVAAAYAGAFFALGVHIRGPVADRNWVYVSWVAVALVGLAALLIVQLRKAPQLALKAANAHVLSPDARPKLQQLVARVAAQADLPTPLVAVVHSHTRNSFVVGRTARSAVLALTTGLLGELDERELEAVIAHELAHVANGDAVVMTIVSAPVTLGTTLWERREGWGEGLVWVFGVLVPGLAVLYAVGLVLQRAMSRYREYAADRGSALVTGAPISS